MSDNMKVEGKQEKKVTLGLVLSWIFGAVFGVAGLVIVFTKLITGLLLMLAGLILLPPVSAFLKEKGKFSLSGGLKFVLVLILLVIAVIIPTTDSDSDISEHGDTDILSQQEESQEAIQISAVALSTAYDENKVSADAKYEDKLVEVTGVIDDIGKDILDTAYVTLIGSENVFFGIQCMFEENNENQIASLSKGQPITLRGEVSGELLGNVIIDDCEVVN